MENWKEKLADMLVGYRHKFTLREQLESFITRELSKAREEGRKEVLKEVEYALAKDLRYELRFTEIQEVLSKLKQ